jgi:hypothetical protein
MVAALVVIMALIVILILRPEKIVTASPVPRPFPARAPNSRRTTKLSSASNRRSEW